MNKKTIITAAIAICAVIVIVIACVCGVQGSRNGAIDRETLVDTALSNISVVEMERQTILVNLADAVKSYDKHEYDTLVAVINSRNNDLGENGIREINTLVQAIAEKYPELKSHENYKIFMNEAIVVERQVKQYRENYNNTVKDYTRYCNKFPTRYFLDWAGYEVQTYEQLKYNTTPEGPTNLLGGLNPTSTVEILTAPEFVS